MTRQEFIAEHGPDWRKFIKKPIFEALLSMIESENPARSLPLKQDNDRLHGAILWVGESTGWEKLRSLLVNLSTDTPAETEVPDKFTDPEV